MKVKTLISGLSMVTVLMLGTTSVVVADDVVENTSEITGWVTTRIPYDISVKELAQRYYGDKNDYMLIVNANKGRVGKNLMVRKHTEIKIPITSKFKDQPEILGWE